MSTGESEGSPESRRVRIWAIKTNTPEGGRSKKGKRSYTVRWVVAGREKSRTFVTRALADSFRSDLMQAANQGEGFDIETGLPDSMTEAPTAVTWLDFAKKYVDMKWPGAAAKSRDSMTEALAAVTAALVRDVHGRPPVELLRRALRNHLLPPPARDLDMPPDVADAVRWLRHASLPLPDIREAATVRGALDVLAVKLDGTPAAATTVRRKRSVFYNVLQYAVELEELEFNPIDKLRVRSQRKKIAEVVDRRVVVNQRQALELLIAVTYVGQRGRKAKRGERLVAFFAACTLPRSVLERR